MKTPPGTTKTITVPVCPRCGTIGKSGKMSCCGRGGAWFKNCGGDGNTQLHHTWYEGIQACKARSQSNTVISQQVNVGQHKGMGSSEGAGMTNYKAVIAASKTLLFTSVDASAPILDTTPITVSARTLMTNPSTNSLMIPSTHTSASTSITTHLLKITVHINLLFIIDCVLMSSFI